MSLLSQKLSRREFLKSSAVCGAFFAAGLPRRAVWAHSGSPCKKLKIVFFTDVHTRLEWDTPLALKRTAELINAHKPDFVIGGGDLITDGFQCTAEQAGPRWDAYLQMHRELIPAVYPAIGNHDLVAVLPANGAAPSDDPRRVFKQTFSLSTTHYSWNAGGCHFIILDSIHVSGDDLKYHGMIVPEQLEWLKQDLARVPKGMPVVVTTHIPLLTSFYQFLYGTAEPAPLNRVVVNSRDVLECFNEHNLILVLQGHLHVEEMIKWRGTTFITGGAVCGKWWRGDWYGTEEGFGIVSLENSKVVWEYVDCGWDARRPDHL